MKRWVWLLVALFSVWLFALPGVAAKAALTRAAVATASSGKLGTSVEQVRAPSVSLSIARAPLFARLRIALPAFSVSRSWKRVAPLRLRDLRRAVRRAQARRGMPRSSAGEPP